MLHNKYLKGKLKNQPNFKKLVIPINNFSIKQIWNITPEKSYGMLIILSNNQALTESVLVPTKENYFQYGYKYLQCTSSRCMKILDGLVKVFPQHGFGQGYFFTSLDFRFWLCHDSPLSSSHFTWCFKLDINDNSILQSSLGHTKNFPSCFTKWWFKWSYLL